MHLFLLIKSVSLNLLKHPAVQRDNNNTHSVQLHYITFSDSKNQKIETDFKPSSEHRSCTHQSV